MANTVSDNNKRIVKNSMLLYIRMFIIMGIGFYTSRVVLQNLGVVDYGINNVVAGMVSMFTFLNTTLATGTQRFITFALGENDLEKSKKTFSTAFIVHLGMALVLAIVVLICGLWLMNGHLTIPEDRLDAAYWVFYTAIATIMLSVTQVPYMSTLIAHENMKVYAYMAIYDAVAKLVVAFLLIISTVDNLKLYAVLNLVFSGVGIFIYRIYCKKKYDECNVIWKVDKQLLKSILSFSGWNVLGCAASIFSNQGVNIILNIFFGPVVNAARGIANQVNNMVIQFVANFQTAANPQIVKYHASGDNNSMISLIINNAKYAGLLMVFVLIPLFVETPFILKLWLCEFPADAIFFIRVILIQSLFQTISRPVVMGIHAVGRMKIANIYTGSNLLLILPVTWILLKIGVDLNLVLIINVIPWIIEPLILMKLLDKYISFPIMKFYTYVYGNIFLISFISLAITFFVHETVSGEIVSFFLSCLTSTLVTGILVYTIGLNQQMRNMFNQNILKIVQKLKQ